MTAQTILPANSVVDSGFNVDNSCRFNNASDDSLTRSKGASETSTRTATYSFWIKRAEAVGTDMWIYSNEVANDNNRGYIQFNTDSNFRIIVGEGADTQIYFITNAKFRDFSAWSHWVISIDTTQGTEANRFKLYHNGVQVTSFSQATYPSENADLTILVGGQTNKEHIGNIHGQSAKLSAYLCEFVFVDGLQLAADQFGEFDSDSGIWKPIDVSGITLGNQGYYLDFKDSSAFGNSVGNSNNFTVNNLTAVDQSTDTCTNNFATMNPLDNFYAAHPFAEGNTKVSTSTSTTSFSTATIGLSTGKWYFEGTVRAVMGEEGIGVSPVVSTADDDYPGKATDSVSYKGNNGNVRKSNSNAAYGNAYVNNNVIGVALNLDDNEIKFYLNGTVQNSGTAVALTAAASTPNGVYFPMVGDGSTDSVGVWEVNFGAGSFTALSSAVADGNGFGAFEYAPPSGFLAICTKNLAENG